MVCKLADGTEKKATWTKAIRPVYREAFVTRDISLDFAKAAWLQYLERKLNYVGVPSLGARDALLKKHPITMASVRDEG